MNKNIDLQQMEEFFSRQMPVKEIAEFFQCSKANVYSHRRRYTKNGNVGRIENAYLSPTDRKKVAARNMMSRAIMKGQLVPQPCEVCGVFGVDVKGNSLVHGHHDDYNKPFQVRWLCCWHHAQWHKENTPIE